MSLKKKIERQLNRMPKYGIQDEAFQTQSVARQRAFGRDRDIAMRQEDIEQGAANAANEARNTTSSTADLLGAISAIEAGKGANIRALAQDEQASRAQKTNELYSANQMMIDEKDKAWRQNVYAPYTQKLMYLQERKKRRQALTDAFSGAAIAVGSTAATSGNADNGGGGDSGGNAGGLFGMLGSIFSDERLKVQITDTDKGLDVINSFRVVEYKYQDDPETNHIGLIAQEVGKTLPEAVVVNGEYLMLNYNELVPVLIKAVQDLQKELASLKK